MKGLQYLCEASLWELMLELKSKVSRLWTSYFVYPVSDHHSPNSKTEQGKWHLPHDVIDVRMDVGMGLENNEPR